MTSDKCIPSTGINARMSSGVGNTGITAGLLGRDSLGVPAGLVFVRRILSCLARFVPSLISASLPAMLAGEVGRDIVLAVFRSPLGCFFFGFLAREDSLPLASERLGDPGLFRIPFRRGSEVLMALAGVPGVLVVVVPTADPGPLPFSAACFSSSSFFSFSFSRSTSLSSESLYLLLVCCHSLIMKMAHL